MANNRFFPGYMRVVLFVLMVVFPVLVFSCKSTAPSSGNAASLTEAGSLNQPEKNPEPVSVAEAGVSGTAGQETSTEPPAQPAPPPAAAGAETGSTVTGFGDEPVTTVPPEAPAEPAPAEAPKLPEPQVSSLPHLTEPKPAERPPDKASSGTPQPAPTPAPAPQPVPAPQPAPVISPEGRSAAVPQASPPAQASPGPNPEQTGQAGTPGQNHENQALTRPETPRQAPPPPAPREPPVPPAFLRQAEEVPRPPAPPSQGAAQANSLPDMPARLPAEPSGDKMVFSRVVRAIVGQVIEIPFRGTGWVYLGELGNRRGIAYDSRRLDLVSRPGGSSGSVGSAGSAGSAGSVEGQSFIFNAETAGTYILKFYRQDFIQDFIINDYVQVIVGEASDYSGAGRYNLPVDRGRVVAEPRWPPASESPPAVQNPPPAAAPASAPQPVPVPQPAPAPSQPSQPAPTPAPAPQSVPSPQPAPVQPSAPVARPATGQTAVPGQTSAPPPAAPTLPRAAADDSIVPVVPPQAVSAVDPRQAGVLPQNLIPANAAPAEYVRAAKQEFDAGRVEPALAILDSMKQRYPSGTDEAWWLYGQLLEANSSSRDVRLALDYYRRLVREYPQSSRAGDAQRRISYLERYYFNIR